MTTRRTFLAQAGLAAAGALLAPKLLSATTTKHKIGLQLYSLRDYIPKDVKGVIAKVAKAGYKEVETYDYSKKAGFWGLDAKAFASLLKEHGLTTTSGHYDFDSYLRKGDTEALKTYIEAALITGQSYVVAPWIDGDLLKTESDLKKIAESLNKAGELCNKAGIKLAYHNHNFEWNKVGNTTLYDTLLKETDAKLVKMEMDIYWVTRAGKNAIELFEKHPNRFALVHVKDMDKANHNINTEVGSGLVDFKTILPKAKAAGVKHFIVEQENFTNIDPYMSITQSCNYMKNNIQI